MRTEGTALRCRWLVVCVLWAGLQLSGNAAFDSTLEAVPADARAVLHVRNMRTVSNKVDQIATELTGTETRDLATRLLAKMVGAGFVSIDDLADNGFDVENDFTLFWLASGPERFTTIIHIKDEASVRRVLSREGFTPNEEYGGIPYATFGPRSIAFFDDLLVYSNVEGAMPRIIDAGNKEAPSILVAPRFRDLGLTPKEVDLTAYLDVASLSDVLDSFAPSKDNDAETDESRLLKEVDTLGVTLTFEDGILRYHHEMRFREGSPFAVAVSADRNRPLRGIDTLPRASVAVASGIFSAEEYRAYTRQDKMGDAPSDAADRAIERLMAALKDIPTDYEGEISVALRFHQSPLPDLVAVVPLAGHDADTIMTAMLPPVLEAFSPGTDAESVPRVPPRTTDWGTVKGWRFPTTLFQTGENVPPPLVLLFPRELGLWYTVDGDDLLVSLAASDASLLWATGARRGGETLENDASLTNLRKHLPNEGVWVGYFSPSRFFKAYGPIVSLMVPQSQGLVERIASMQERLSLGAVIANRDAGNAVTIAVRVADWGPVVEILRDLSRPRQTGEPSDGTVH